METKLLSMNETNVRKHLQAFAFKALCNEIGWDNHTATVHAAVEGQSYSPTAVAEKRGMVAFVCEPDSSGDIPPYPVRRKIEQQVAKSVREHIIVFVDRQHHAQVWQWVRRDAGKPAAYREHAFDARYQSGTALLQKLRHIAYDLEDEETLTLTLVGTGARKAFDVEKVTKKFYEQFKKQHADFHTSIQGIDLPDDLAWYTSVMLNRLMFVYFVQQKRFLDDDPNYLRTRLKRVRAAQGAGHFHAFYSLFLLRLFHEGLGQKPDERTPEESAELAALLGRVPYLNGGIFAPHSLEERYPAIRIEDAAFERIFDFFDNYRWHLDERPLKDDREINPDVLGYIFEKYINQKEMGAYYTKEDITEYIGRNTILPYLFDAAQPECAIAFREDGSVWRCLRENPDRYLFEAVRKGVDLPLPENIVAGVADVTKRGDWNRPAPEAFALPTEIWRETVARRQRCDEVRKRLAAGEVHSINDLITYNLNVRQFAQDVVEQCEGPETLRAFWKALQTMRVLDPTVGSGAFLFAALNILEPLYEAVLERMEAFVGDADRADPDRAGARFPDFRQVLARIDGHPNRKHFIYKTVIVNNLYGVDIMEEATEICKLRLFLKLVAQVETVADLEPLPDIDFNIRAGNTLVGYARIDDIDRLWTEAQFASKNKTGNMSFERDREKLEMRTRAYADLLHDFRDQQLGLPTPKTVTKKDVERAANEELRPELEKDLWRLYRTAGKLGDKVPLAQFRASHNPLHWFVEFPEVMAHGGFGVIIGNPPYVEYSKVTADYRVLGFQTETCGNLYALSTEQGVELLKDRGRLGVIIPVASVCTDGYNPLQHKLIDSGHLHISNYNDRPSKLFDGLEHIRLSIILLDKTRSPCHMVYTSRYNKWHSVVRPQLFEMISFGQVTEYVVEGSIPKVASPLERSILPKVLTQTETMETYASTSGGYRIYYTRKLSGFVQVLDFVPEILDANGMKRAPSELKDIAFEDGATRDIFLTVLNSSLFYWLLTVYSDCRNLNRREVYSVCFDKSRATDITQKELSRLARELMQDFGRTSKMLEMKYERVGKMTIQCIYPKHSKAIIDEIDRALARHYGFTDEELDFILNYDIKYRMGRGAEDDGGE